MDSFASPSSHTTSMPPPPPRDRRDLSHQVLHVLHPKDPNKNVFREVEHSYIPLPLTPSLSLYYLVSLAPGIELPLPCRAPQH